MEEYFLIKEFEDGYDINELIYEEVSHDYCINVLDIPEHNIESIHFNEDGMELILKELTAEDIADDWFVHLCRISN